MISYRKLFANLFLFFVLINSAFAINTVQFRDCSNVGSGDSVLGCMFSKQNFEALVTGGLGWMDWFVYLFLLVGATIFVRNVLPENIKGKRARTSIAFFVSFMGITGFMWVLVSNGLFPHYFVLFAGEILVLILVAWLVLHGLKKDEGNKKEYKYHISYRIFIVLLALLLYNSYQTMLLDTMTGNNPVLSNGEGNNGSLLYSLALFHLPLPFVAYVILFFVLLFLFSDGDGDDDKKGSKKKKEDKETDEAKKLLSVLQEEFKKFNKDFEEYQNVLKRIIDKTKNYQNLTEESQSSEGKSNGGNS